ncbi:hypothetical protein GGTG_12619 [Gaeumannomyces tritici R3-111a-1]|uniref:Uncharacterized protein n=1 Tax=Gaeumannomyces tritici (strain R3-111a-1) TaxID=644352 RepID=J3PGJ1_GAET3|nr:hypothetical protein GGTG_12619 [Gaeumannomyces tritici R3-111a-1]EJT69736.1 hypothetical protein GGTG_12619 [Gaeumannomyces tritici R3-111a-1]
MLDDNQKAFKQTYKMQLIKTNDGNVPNLLNAPDRARQLPPRTARAAARNPHGP